MRIKLIFIVSIAGLLLLASLPGPGDAEQAGTHDIRNLANEFVSSLEKGNYTQAAALFDATMKGAMPPANLEEAWGALVARNGPLLRKAGVRTERWQQYDLVFVRCEFERSALDIKVVFDGAQQISGLWFVPSLSADEYSKQTGTIKENTSHEHFTERDVIVGSGELALPGTLTLPLRGGPFPAAVLVHGSGPNDRDETIGPNKPFRDIAWGLAERGIAVLRYEKRTKEHGGKLGPFIDGLTVQEETIDDVLSAVSLLRRTERVDAEGIFVIGHSLGGMLVPRIGVQDPGIAGFVIMAGATRPLEDMIVEQVTYIYGIDGAISETERAYIALLKAQASAVKDPGLSADTPPGNLPPGTRAAYWLDLRGYRPHVEANRLSRPILILQGGRDYQVTKEDFGKWKEALSRKGNVEFRLYPALNHLFISGKGPCTPEEYSRPGQVESAVIDDISAWIVNRRQ